MERVGKDKRKESQSKVDFPTFNLFPRNLLCINQGFSILEVKYFKVVFKSSSEFFYGVPSERFKRGFLNRNRMCSLIMNYYEKTRFDSQKKLSEKVDTLFYKVSLCKWVWTRVHFRRSSKNSLVG